MTVPRRGIGSFRLSRVACLSRRDGTYATDETMRHATTDTRGKTTVAIDTGRIRIVPLGMRICSDGETESIPGYMYDSEMRHTLILRIEY